MDGQGCAEQEQLLRFLKKLKEVFDVCDQDAAGYIRVEHFVHLGLRFGQGDEVKKLTKYLDPQALGRINFKDFCHGVFAIKGCEEILKNALGARSVDCRPCEMDNGYYYQRPDLPVGTLDTLLQGSLEEDIFVTHSAALEPSLASTVTPHVPAAASCCQRAVHQRTRVPPSLPEQGAGEHAPPRAGYSHSDSCAERLRPGSVGQEDEKGGEAAGHRRTGPHWCTKSAIGRADTQEWLYKSGDAPIGCGEFRGRFK